MKKLSVAAFVILLTACLGARATEYAFTVGEGETKTLQEMVSAASIVFQDGDWIVKKGLGTLKNTAQTFKGTNLNIRVEQGVYYISGSKIHVAEGKKAELVVLNGATFNTAGSMNGMEGSGWKITFAGNGAGFGDNLGALCVGGGEMNPIIGSNNSFTMTGDATIYGYGTMNAVFSGSGASSGPTLHMNGHTLTIRGKQSSSVFRPRWKWTVKTPGPMIVRNGQFARHLTTNEFVGHVPRITFTEGAKMAAYNSTSLWGLFDSFEFDGTAVLASGNGSPSQSTISMNELIGPAKITAAATVTVTNRHLAHAAHLAAGKFLSATNTLTFTGAEIAVDGLAALPLASGGSYTLAESAAGIAGDPVLAGESANVFALSSADEGKRLVLTVKANTVNAVADWGLASGAAAAAANAAAIAAKLATLQDGDTVFFPEGVYAFDGGLDLSSLAAANVRFVGTKACISSPVTLPPAEKGFAFDLGGYVFAGDTFILNVPAGAMMAWSDVTALEGFDTALLAGKTFLKRGGGTFKPAADLSGLGISNVVVESGVWYATADTHLGTLKAPVTVRSGATLYGSSGGSQVIKNRRLNLAGAGAPGQKGAIVYGPSIAYNTYSHNSYYLDADATLYSMAEGTDSGAGTFHWTDWVYFNGHTLLLTAANNGYSFRAGRCFNPASSGTLVISNATFTTSAEGDGFVYQRRNNAQMHTVLKGTARLYPEAAAYKVFNDIEGEMGTTINPTTSGSVVSLDYLGGAPATGTKVAGYELKNGYQPVLGSTFTTTVPVNFASGAVIDVRDRASLLAHAGETLTVLESPAVTGTPAAGGANGGFYTVSSTETSVSITIPAHIVLAADLGLSPENSAADNVAALATALGTLANDTTVVFAAGVYDFGESMDLSGLTATGVRFSGTGATAFKSPVVLSESVPLSIIGITYRTADAVYIHVAAGATKSWAQAWQGAGWAEAPTNVDLHKTGSGTFAPGESLNDYSVIVYVDEGVMKTTASAQLGKAFEPITVAEGATLWLNYTSAPIVSDRRVKFAGAGAPGMSGAIVLDGQSGVWNYCSATVWELTGDAVMFSKLENNNNGVFLNSSFDLQGHVLTLRGRDDLGSDKRSVYRVSRSCDWRSAGKIVFDRVAVNSSDGDNSANYGSSTGATGTWRFVNGSVFKPDDAGVLGLFGAVTLDFAKGTTFQVPKTNLANKCACGHAAVGRFAGVPTITGADRTLSITNVYTAHAADIVASNTFAYANGTLVFERGSTVEIDGDLTTLPPLDLTLGTAGTLTKAGSLKSGPDLREADMRGYVADNALKVGTRLGMILLIK